jgi:alpha-mannosidase
VPVQQTRSLATVGGSRGRLVFPADLQPLGYRVYRLYPGPAEAGAAVSATDTSLENEFLRIEVDPATGWLSRLEDKRSAGTNLAAQGAHAVVVDDRSDTWGHRVRAYDRVAGGFECTSVRLVEQGPVRAILRIESRYGDSTLLEELVLSAGARQVEVRVVLDWRERLKLLKLRFPTSLDTDRATFEVPYGHVERAADGGEQPAQGWVDVSDGRAGLSVLNDGKCGHDAQRGEIGITVARSPVYAWHDPRELEEDGVSEYLDQGRQAFAYALLPHGGDWREAGTVRLAAELNQPPFALLESYHPGDLPSQASYASDGEGPVVVSAVKAAEDGDGSLVVRAYESAGQPARATIALPLLGRTIEAGFGAAEIKTFRIPRDPGEPHVETSLLEW